MEQAKGTKQMKAYCVYFILCSGEVPAHHTTDTREEIGIYSYRNNSVVQTTTEVSPLPHSFSPVLPSQAPLSAAFSSAAGGFPPAGKSMQIPPVQRDAVLFLSVAPQLGPAQRSAWLPKHAGGHWPMDACPTDTRVPVMAGRGCKKL